MRKFEVEISQVSYDHIVSLFPYACGFTNVPFHRLVNLTMSFQPLCELVCAPELNRSKFGQVSLCGGPDDINSNLKADQDENACVGGCTVQPAGTNARLQGVKRPSSCIFPWDYTTQMLPLVATDGPQLYSSTKRASLSHQQAAAAAMESSVSTCCNQD